MAERSVTIECSGNELRYDIRIGGGILERTGRSARRALGPDCCRIVIISNRKVFGLYGKIVETSLREAGFEPSTWLMGDGERYKNMRSLQAALGFMASAGLARTDAVVALGGGVVGDLAGFASSIYLRGVDFIQIPTTLLAMIDSSVGGKTGINTDFGKNTIGAFHQPKGVLIDVRTLSTLPKRELTAGFCEAIKQGAVAGNDLFDQTSQMLERYSAKRRAWQSDRDFQRSISEMIAAHVAFKAEIVSGDQFETVTRKDGRSRKILNFGHTLAHALERATDYKYLKHGEAVGYGILYAAELSKALALMDEKSVNLLYDVVHRAGALPPLDDIDQKVVFEAFRFDKKHIARTLQMVLLKGIGNPVIVSGNDIAQASHSQALNRLFNK